MKIKNVKIVEVNPREKSAKLDKVLSIMRESGIDDAENLLPTSRRHKVDFVISDTFSGFANAIRRCLMSEIEVSCMDYDKDDLVTNDEFILYDLFQKNVNLVPINQEFKMPKDLNLYLHVRNTTNSVMDITVDHIRIGGRDKRKSKPEKGARVDEKEPEDVEEKGKYYKLRNELLPERNIIILRLRPGKFVELRKINIITGFAREDAAKFTLLNNIRYWINDVTPYDPHTGTGQRSVESDPAEFSIGYTTKGNISPNKVMALCCDSLVSRLGDIKKTIERYIKHQEEKGTETNYYNYSGLEVVKVEDLYTYKFENVQLTLGLLLAHQIYKLDENINYCNASSAEHGTEKMILRIRHPEPNPIINDAIDECVGSLQLVKKEF